jgi:hypothetical protein
MTRTNLITNASFRTASTGTTGWSALSTASIARITTDGFIGTSCLQVSSVTSTSTGVILTDYVTIDESKDYSISAYLKIASGSTAGSITMTTTWYNSSNSSVLSSTAALNVPADGVWYRIGATVLAATIPGTAVKAKVQFTPTTSSTVTSFSLDAILFEQDSYIEEFYENFDQVLSTVQSQVETKDSTILAASKQSLENNIVNAALRKMPSPYISGLKLNADININGLVLNTIDENNVVWVCTDIKGWWTLPDTDVPDIARGLDDGSYDVRGRWKARAITLEGSILPPHPDYIAAARSKLISALSPLVYLGGTLAVDEGPIKISKVFMVAQPTMDVKNARGRIDFSIQLRAGDPVKYGWNYEATDGYYSATPFQFKVSSSITNVTIPVAGTRRYTTTNTFVAGDYVTISGITPSGYNTTSTTAPVAITAVDSGGTWFETAGVIAGSGYVSESSSSARLAYSSTSITNSGNTYVPTVITLTGPMASGSYIKNLTNSTSIKLVKQLRPAGYSINIGYVSRFSNVATLTTSSATGHGLFVGDTVNISISGYGSFNATPATITSVTTNTFTYASSGADLSSTSVSSSTAILVSADTAVIDTYNQTVKYRGIADAGRSILDANIDWIRLIPGVNTIQIQTQDTSVSDTTTKVVVQYRSGWIG